MQTLQTILTLIQPNCYMATINLKDAYYSVKIDGNDTCFLKFLCNSKLLKFLSCPMICHQVLKVYKTDKVFISNFKNARIYSCNIH